MITQEVINIEKLVSSIQETNHYFFYPAQKQVNTALTLRNWIIGFYIVEYEKYGDDRAEYGQKLFKEIVNKLKTGGLSSIRERHLYLCKDFYKAYPKILQTVSAKLHLSDNQYNTILRQCPQNLWKVLLDKLQYPHFRQIRNFYLTNLAFHIL
jgi:hypothetical protein